MGYVGCYVGYGEEHTIEELAHMCREILGTDVPVEYVDYRPGEEGQREAFSTEKARRVLKYQPEFPPGQAISLTADWMVKALLDFPPGGVDRTLGTP